MEAMIAKQEAEFGDLMKDKEFRDLAGEFEMVDDPDMAELHKEMQRQGKSSLPDLFLEKLLNDENEPDENDLIGELEDMVCAFS